MQERAESRNRQAHEVPHEQRAVPRTLKEWLAVCSTREEALRAAHVDSAISMSEIARELGISVSRVSQLIKKAEGKYVRAK